jgi:hypothetical protein
VTAKRHKIRGFLWVGGKCEGCGASNGWDSIGKEKWFTVRLDVLSLDLRFKLVEMRTIW